MVRVAVIITVLCLTFGVANAQFNSFKHLSMDMQSKSAAKGFVKTVDAKILYSADGSMITEFAEPVNTTVLANTKGDIRIYNRAENSVYTESNYLFSSEHSQLFYFLSNQSFDMGLSNAKFTQSNVRFEEGLMISEWLPPAEMAASLSKVELVTEEGRPIYMAYFGQDGRVTTKTYYSDYESVSHQTAFPSRITQITFSSPYDSAIIRTIYSNVATDNAANKGLLDFQIPTDAKSIN